MFSAYAQIAPNRYREIFGLDFEQFSVGQTFRHRPGITISQQDNVEESVEMSNSAQFHYDAHYASKTEWKHCLVVSTLTLQKALGAAWKTFARKERISCFENITLSAPVFDGATLYGESRIVEVNDNQHPQWGEVVVETDGIDSVGRRILTARYVMQIYKKGQHPYYKTLQYDLTHPKFMGYHQNHEGVLTEQVGIFFDDLEAGEVYEHAPSKTILPSEALKHAYQSLEWNPRYINPEFASEYFDEPLNPVSEIYLMGVLTAFSTRTLGRVVANLGWSNYQLNRHVYPNEKLHGETEILEKRESKSRPDQGVINVRTYAFDASHAQIASYDRVLLMYKKGHGPYHEAGY